ncbi:NEDD8-activating enzyme E1 regulatory subunit [Schistocerca piceifrons]|uniref:NEDD8-activating enzyme E1 regulatory subunit n=1 Tax=Schistocerca piceifrons TaxID=274613 RepID=UPI001F5F4C5B|nr:NEDD8-activating enzyme E1 regulatory subunit [Schistocerca piceifrons]XP_049784326.1 NEDD8-activating enzyme E1 regulatory subunit [Schistocerca cancellata]XP_049828729.1 NEDD8-activating enzyme E1 regulatory subunit [Schistocerca gregaria]
MASPAPKSPEQSDKSKKYDRQLRLWGDHGQAALELSQVCLINANGLGTEILKSLVLPGIGAFTIVDGKKVTEEDIGCNFFLDVDSCGKSRAQVATQLLLELNPDVRGDYVDEDVEQLLENSADFFNNFTVVIGSSLTERVLIPLSKKLWELDIPFIVCRSYGFVGYARIQVAEHTVIETHPDNQMPDLRLDKPFSALQNHIDCINLDLMEYKDHAHVPYVIILYKYLQKWREQNGGRLPNTFKEKERLREMIRQGMFRDEHGNVELEENFEEAVKAVNYAVTSTAVPSSVREILDDDACINLTSKSKPFWIMAKAVRDYIDNEGQGCLPLRGTLPDMTAETERYIALQQVYHSEAAKDADVVFRRVQQLLHQLNQPADTITEKDVKTFCKHASNLHLLRGTRIADEYDPKTNNAHNIAMNLENPESPLVYYLMLRGVDRFFAEYNAYPGEFDDQVEPDIVKLKACISKLLSEWGCGPLAKDDYVHEISRYGGAELHSVSAFMGGCIAHETIKFITGQYKPVNNTFIYDAITCSSATFSL